VPPDWHHPAPLIAIGKPKLPLANMLDHEIERVIAALTPELVEIETAGR
jgi:hypothetical protein